MLYLCREKPASGPTHESTLRSSTDAARWIAHRAAYLAPEEFDLYTKNVFVMSMFVPGRIESGEAVTWTVGKPETELRIDPVH